MLDTTAQPFSLARTLLVLGLFVLVMAVAVVVINIEQDRTVKKELRRRELETLQRISHLQHDLQRKAKLRRMKEQEAADDYLLDKIQEYHNDFDDNRQAG